MDSLTIALLLLGKTSAAKAWYGQWASKPFNPPSQPTYREAFLSDLDLMEAQSVPGIDYEKVRGWLRL